MNVESTFGTLTFLLSRVSVDKNSKYVVSYLWPKCSSHMLCKKTLMSNPLCGNLLELSRAFPKKRYYISRQIIVKYVTAMQMTANGLFAFV